MLINCDMGEALFPNPDPDVMPLIDLANIACGGHAGNHQTIKQTLELAHQHDKKIGAHPSYPDKKRFGRVSISMDEISLRQTIATQIESIQSEAEALEMAINHIKPHGALYLDIIQKPRIFKSMLSLCQEQFPQVPLMIQGGVSDKVYLEMAKQQNVPLLFEFFADRAYLPNGLLTPRSVPGSLYQTPELIVKQALHFIQQKKGDTICFHSDNPASVEALKQLANRKEPR